MTDKVVCREAPSQSYALYLPSTYTPEKPSPILYMLDARGRALLPIERFRAAAEEFGWVLASSYNSHSDTSNDSNTPALQAMWRDTHARLAIDERRAYLSGFSGGARASVDLALSAPKAIAGVIGCGAGLPDDRAPVKSLPFPYFGTAGNRDFNYYEMRELEGKLADAKVEHRIEFFDGGHDWPPPELAQGAIAWMELAATKSGARSRDDERIAALYARDLDRAQALAAQGNETGAYLAYAYAVEDFRGLADVTAPAEKAAALGSSASVRKTLRDAEKRDARDRAEIRELARKVHVALNSPEVPLPAAVTTGMGIEALRKQATTGAAEDRLCAERILANLRVQSSFYLPEQFLAQKDYQRARLALLIAAAIDPEDPLVYYNLACASARAGHVGRTLADLQDAVARGFRRFAMIDDDPDFAAVRGDPKFRAWIEEARARADAPKAPP